MVELSPRQEQILDSMSLGLPEGSVEYVKRFEPLIGGMAVGEKALLTPQDEQVYRDDLDPIFAALDNVLYHSVCKAYSEDRGGRYLPLSPGLGDIEEEGFYSTFVSGFYGRLANVEITRLPNEEEDFAAFFRAAKRHCPSPRSAPREFFGNYLVSIDKKSGGRQTKKAIGRVAYYANSLHARGVVSGRLVLVEDKTALDLKNAIDTARMLESVQVINTVVGGAVSPR